MRRRDPYKKPDARTRAAKERGYPARSVFKLEEIERRLRLFRSGQRVLDLGAAPGSWSLYASQRIGPGGRVVAVDRTPMEQAFPANVTPIVGDAFDLSNAELSAQAPYDVVLSDMAPNTSGDKIQDRARSQALFLRALELSCAVGKKGGSFVGKIFMSEDFGAARAATEEAYGSVQVIRPAGTRTQSSELFIVGTGRR